MLLSICALFWVFSCIPLRQFSAVSMLPVRWSGTNGVCKACQLKTVHTAPRSHILLKLFRRLCTLQSFMTWKPIGRAAKCKFVFTKRLSLDSRKHQYYCAHWRKERARSLSELDLLLELEVLWLIFNNPVSDLHCKKEMCVSHACICLMHLQKRATKMHAVYKRAWAYASDATPKLQGCSGCAISRTPYKRKSKKKEV